MSTQPPASPRPEAALRVVSLESRHASEMIRLLERHGCRAISAPSMREVPLSDQHDVFVFGDQLLGSGCDIIVLLTGVGTRFVVDVLSTRVAQTEVVAALGRARLVCRGPKPVAVLKSLGLKPTLVAPEPNTWQDLLQLLDQQLPVRGRDVYVQEYGRSNPALLEGLRERGATVRTVAVYAWGMPDDPAPLSAAVDLLCDGGADVLLMTSGQQLEHLFAIAAQRGRDEVLREALRARVLCASIGPVTSEGLVARGLAADLTPVHPKMGHLVAAVASEGPGLLAAKRARLCDPSSRV